MANRDSDKTPDARRSTTASAQSGAKSGAKAGERGDLLRGNLELMLLSVLADGAKYGYSIQQRLQEASQGSIQVQAGTLYPLLHRLEQESLIRSHWEDETGRRRKWYELTAKGARRLKQRAAQWTELASVVGELLRPVLEPRPKPA